MKRESFFEFDSLALDLYFCSEVLKLESLHYGLFDDPNARAPTLENLRRAQARYSEALYALVPEGTQSVLDVGCGLGDVARGLAERGYQVTAISPDRNHGRYLRELDPGVEFVQARFESFSSPERFDLVLMSESQNHFPAEIGFEQSARHLRPGGALLVCGMFRKRETPPFAEHVNRIDEFIAGGARAGFELVEDRDITRDVLPTLELAHAALESFVEPSLELLRRFLKTTSPLKAKAMSLLFKRQLDELESIRRYLAKKTDPDEFADKSCYRRLLFARRAVARAA